MKKSSNQESSADIMLTVLVEDVHNGFLRSVISMKKKFESNKSTTHVTYNQQWMFSEYLYQLLVVLEELLDYLSGVVDTVIVSGKDGVKLLRKIRMLSVKVEAVNKDGFAFMTSIDESVIEDTRDGAHRDNEFAERPNSVDDDDDLGAMSDEKESADRVQILQDFPDI